MGTQEAPAIYGFGLFVLDLRRGVLLEDGAERALRPKSFALLRHLVENCGRVVSRDEILDCVRRAKTNSRFGGSRTRKTVETVQRFRLMAYSRFGHPNTDFG